MKKRERFVAGCLVLLLAGFAAETRASCPAEYQAGQREHWANGAVFYQIFVRSFQDSDGDGIGDFPGLISRLDYLNDGDPETTTDLGIDAVWLMPITQSPSYHGYDTTDYDHVEDDYGTDEDFARFLEEAHRRGIRVIIDLVVNHCSAQHPWFVGARSAPTDPHHDWFVWRPDDPGWTQPWSSSPTWHFVKELDLYYYGLFWGGMPDLNYENPEVRQEMTQIALRWMRKGVDGFRLDASRHIIEAGSEEKADGSPETHQWWRDFAKAVKAEFPQALFVGENWTNIWEIADYYGSAPNEQLDMSFNFDLSDAFIKALRAENPEPIAQMLCEVAQHYPPHALDATFLTNHDMIRVLTQLDHDRDKARLGASLLLTLPGIPFLYYGEEIGMKNGRTKDDPDKRTPMQWTPEGGFTSGKPWQRSLDDQAAVNVQTEEQDPDSLLHHYRHLIRLRHSRPALARGEYTFRTAKGEAASSVFAFERRHGAERLLVVANLGGSELSGVLLDLNGTDGSGRTIFPADSVLELDEGAVNGPLPARRLVVFELAPGGGP